MPFSKLLLKEDGVCEFLMDGGWLDAGSSHPRLSTPYPFSSILASNELGVRFILEMPILAQVQAGRRELPCRPR